MRASFVQRPKLANVFAFARNMGNDTRFRVSMRLHLQQIIRSQPFVERPAPVEHQLCATAVHCFGQQALQCRLVVHLELRDRFNPWLTDLGDQLFERRNSLGEHAALHRQIKHHELQLAPGCVVRGFQAHR